MVGWVGGYQFEFDVECFCQCLGKVDVVVDDMVGFGVYGVEWWVGVEGGDFYDVGGFDVSQLVCLCL